MRQLDIPGLLEELLVLGIGTRPARLYKIHAQVVKFVGNGDLVHELEVYLFGLRAIPQRRVVHYYLVFFTGNHDYPHLSKNLIIPFINAQVVSPRGI